MQSKLDTASKVSKYGPEKTPYFDNFRAVWKLSINTYPILQKHIEKVLYTVYTILWNNLLIWIYPHFQLDIEYAACPYKEYIEQQNNFILKSSKWCWTWQQRKIEK